MKAKTILCRFPRQREEVDGPGSEGAEDEEGEGGVEGVLGG